MIYGITAFDNPVAEIPTGPTGASLDFINGVYTLGSTPLTADQVVTDTARISASGLSILGAVGSSSAYAAVVPSGDLLTFLLGMDFTVIATADMLSGAFVASAINNFILIADDLSLQNASLALQAQAGISGATANLAEFDGGALNPTCFTDALSTAGINRYGYTRQSGHRATTFNGIGMVANGADSTAVSSWAYPAAQCGLAFSWNTGVDGATVGYIRKLEFVNPVSDLQLVALTA